MTDMPHPGLTIEQEEEEEGGGNRRGDEKIRAEEERRGNTHRNNTWNAPVHSGDMRRNINVTLFMFLCNLLGFLSCFCYVLVNFVVLCPLKLSIDFPCGGSFRSLKLSRGEARRAKNQLRKKNLRWESFLKTVLGCLMEVGRKGGGGRENRRKI